MTSLHVMTSFWMTILFLLIFQETQKQLSDDLFSKSSRTLLNELFQSLRTAFDIAQQLIDNNKLSMKKALLMKN